MLSYKLTLLGAPHFTLTTASGGNAIRLADGRVTHLLIRLALGGTAGCSREALCETFWPADEPHAARHRLRQTLVELRHGLDRLGCAPESCLVADRATVRLLPGTVATDVEAFDAALLADDWAAAYALYAGDLTPGYDDPVITAARNRLCVAFNGVLHRLAEAEERAGNLPYALLYAERLAEREASDETVGLLLIRMLLANGRIDAARQCYRKLRRAYHADNGESLPLPVRRKVAALIADAVADAPRETPQKVVVAPTSLPPTPTRLFGREGEIAEIIARLQRPECRLLTLTGPAGSGKSRLAVEVAKSLPDGEPCFVALADIDDAARMADKLVAALRLPYDPKTPTLPQAIAALNATAAERPTTRLLVLDNLEQLIAQPECRATLLALLTSVPQTKILTTSRQPIGMEEENEICVAPLPTAPLDSVLAPGDISEFPGIALFVDRVQAVRPAFHVTARNVANIASLCRSLDGLPLALEIVATWARTLSPSEMAAQLGRPERRSTVLSPRHSTAQTEDRPRHASLQAAIDWSYRPLAPNLQRFFRRLHVFRGGCTAESAATVCEEPNAATLLETLRDQSLVLAGDAGVNAPRYRLLETLREYGREQCGDDERMQVARRHADYYLALAERAEPELLRPDQEAWGARLRAEGDNLRAVLDTALAPEGDAFLGLRLAGTLWRFWTVFAHFGEGRSYLERLLDALPASELNTPIPGRAKALFSLSNVAFYLGDVAEGLARAGECLAVPRLPEDATVAAFDEAWLGVMLFFCGQLAAARSHTKNGLTGARALGDEWVTGYALAQGGLQAFFDGDSPEAFAFCEESLAITDKLGEKWLFGLNNFVLSLCAQHIQQDNAEANRLFERCLRAWEPLNDVWCLAFARTMFAFILQRSGYTDAADAWHREALVRFQEIGEKQGVGTALGGLGESAAAHGDPARATTLWAASDAIYAQIGIPLWPFLQPYRDQAVAEAQAALGDAAFDDARKIGSALLPEQAIALALTTK